jgi:hypothetical protein
MENKLNELLSELTQDIEHISIQHHTGGYEDRQEALKTLEKLKVELRNYVKIKRCNIISTVNDCSSFIKDVGFCGLIDSDYPHRI